MFAFENCVQTARVYRTKNPIESVYFIPGKQLKNESSDICKDIIYL